MPTPRIVVIGAACPSRLVLIRKERPSGQLIR
jgi:hypothetical protein